MRESPLSLPLIVYATVALFFLAALCLYHHLLVCRNKTTNEDLKKSMRRLPRNPFNLYTCPRNAAALLCNPVRAPHFHPRGVKEYTPVTTISAASQNLSRSGRRLSHCAPDAHSPLKTTPYGGSTRNRASPQVFPARNDSPLSRVIYASPLAQTREDCGYKRRVLPHEVLEQETIAGSPFITSHYTRVSETARVV